VVERSELDRLRHEEAMLLRSQMRSTDPHYIDGLELQRLAVLEKIAQLGEP
jgi:hypothetical protein